MNLECITPSRGGLGCLPRGRFLAHHLHIWSWCGCACLSQDGFQLASSPSCCPSPRLRAFSAHVSGWEIHKKVPSRDPVLLLASHLEASAGDQLPLFSLGHTHLLLKSMVPYRVYISFHCCCSNLLQT